MLLDIRQNAFSKLHSTETTVLSLFDDLYNSLDTGQPIQLILLDLSSEFDTLRNAILLERLRNIEIQYVTMEWFSNFIKDRNYPFKIRNNYSKSYTSTTVFLKVHYFPNYLLYIYYSITNNYETLSIYYLQLIRRRHRTTRNDNKLYSTTRLFKRTT